MSLGSTLMSQVLDSFFVSYIAFSLGKLLTGEWCWAGLGYVLVYS